MKDAKDFCIEEFVPPEFFEKMGSLSHRGIDKKIPIICQYFRNEFGPITINNWKWGGDRIASGLRIPGQKEYNAYSDHSRGMACDMVINHYKERDIIKLILENEKFFHDMGITGIEINTFGDDGNGWVHFTTANFNSKNIVIMDAKQGGKIINREVLGNDQENN